MRPCLDCGTDLGPYARGRPRERCPDCARERARRPRPRFRRSGPVRCADCGRDIPDPTNRQIRCSECGRRIGSARSLARYYANHPCIRDHNCSDCGALVPKPRRGHAIRRCRACVEARKEARKVPPLRFCQRCDQGFADFRGRQGTAKLCPTCHLGAFQAKQRRASQRWQSKQAARRMVEQAMKEAWLELHPPPPPPPKPQWTVRHNKYNPELRRAQYKAGLVYQRKYTEAAPCLDCGAALTLPRAGRPPLRCRRCSRRRHEKLARARARQGRATTGGAL
jgi:DNA-directed RNA polymerase subunit RPC12/RpoP